MSPVQQLWQAMRAQRALLAGAAFLGFVAAASTVALLGTSGWLISYAAEMPPVLALSVAAVMVRAFAASSLSRFAISARAASVAPNARRSACPSWRPPSPRARRTHGADRGDRAITVPDAQRAGYGGGT